MSTDEPRRQARKYVKAIKGFYWHACIFCLVNAGLLVLNLTTPHKSVWSLWPMLGWGIGLAANWAAVFRRNSPRSWLGKNWEDRKIEEYLGREVSASEGGKVR